MHAFTEATDIFLSRSAPLSVREALSGIFGSVSLACWIFLLIPQLVENYRNQSAEAISLAFICVWFIGDVANLLGGLWAGLVPTIVAIAVYFCITDGILIGQCLYYGIRNRRREGQAWLDAARGSVTGDSNGIAAEAAEATRNTNAMTGERGGRQQAQPEEEEYTEEEPLLKRTRSGTGGRRSSVTIPGSTTRPLSLQRRKSSGTSVPRRRSSAADDQLAKILEEQDSQSGARLWLKNVISIIAIVAIGTAGWILAYQSGAWTPTPLGDEGDEEPTAKGAQFLGYLSAVAYLGARIPQIVKNWREQSCEGLSLLFFILSLLGNLTYGASILSHSTDRDYVIKNVPWLIGSLGTMVEDVLIFVQFHLYRQQDLEQSIVDT